MKITELVGRIKAFHLQIDAAISEILFDTTR